MLTGMVGRWNKITEGLLCHLKGFGFILKIVGNH